MSGTPAAILLAAGKSRRMGSCKQLLPLGDSTVITRCLVTLARGGIDEIVAVVSEGETGVVEALRGHPVRIVVNPDSEGDMASSVRSGRDALEAGAGGVIVFLCDYPLVSADTIQRLIVGHGNSPASIIIPCHGGRRGHPLLFPRPVLDELTGDKILRDLVRRDPGRVACLDLDDLGVLIDMDTPEEYGRICEIIKSAKQKGVQP